MGELKAVFNKNLKTKIATLLLLNDLKKFKSNFNYKEYGGAPILGLKKPIFKAHGNSDAETFKNAIKQTLDYVKGNIGEELENGFRELNFSKDS